MRPLRQLVATLLATVLLLALPALCLHAVTMPSGPSTTCGASMPMPSPTTDPGTQPGHPSPHTCCTAHPQTAELARVPATLPALHAAPLLAGLSFRFPQSLPSAVIFRFNIAAPPGSATPLRI